MLARVRGLKRKLNTCSEEENRLHQQSQSRIKHLGELYGMQSLDDVKYEEWSRTRLDRLLVDYLLRNGYKESAQALAKEKGIEDLVDVETFVQMSRIRESLQNGRVTEALAWCAENKKDLRRMEVSPCSDLAGSILMGCRVTSSSCSGSSNILSWYEHKISLNSMNR
jgi:macrophage erythroblast attacher